MIMKMIVGKHPNWLNGLKSPTSARSNESFKFENGFFSYSCFFFLSFLLFTEIPLQEFFKDNFVMHHKPVLTKRTNY
ncbi:hypothetical protein EDD64_11515 [Effusibacillus lacus]|nr:hypothetical protein EDD64_11515 [Effusibacillus lacus]